MNLTPTQTTLATGIGSSGLSAALVGILIAILAHYNIQVSDSVAGDIGVVIYAILHSVVSLKLFPAKPVEVLPLTGISTAPAAPTPQAT